jgi:predicted TIM-barrel fold metal-dependent hydrolase
MAELDYAAFDCDNHYHEALDASRATWTSACSLAVCRAEIDGRNAGRRQGERVVVNPTLSPSRAGALQYFRGNPRKHPIELLQERERSRRPTATRCAPREDGRAGPEAMWLFPTLGVLYEELLKHDTEAVTTLFSAFNRWLDEDWGMAYQGRIFSAPYLTLADPEWASRELEWALGRGARIVVMRPAAVSTRNGTFAPSDPLFDPFWARVNESGITLVVHAGDSGYTTHGYVRDGFGASFEGYGRPNIKSFNIERAAYDFLITLAYDKLFERFPNLRIASVENGSEFLTDLFRKLRQSKARTPGYYKEDPLELFRRQVWINPFWEEDPYEVVELMGADRVIFGSDWPHIEGMPEPLDYLPEIAKLDASTTRRILRDNTRELNELHPAR